MPLSIHLLAEELTKDPKVDVKRPQLELQLVEQGGIYKIFAIAIALCFISDFNLFICSHGSVFAPHVLTCCSNWLKGCFLAETKTSSR
jgi:hypothetical protein